MTGSELINNIAGYSGGGIYFISVKNIIIVKTNFSENLANESKEETGGGGFYCLAAYEV